MRLRFAAPGVDLTGITGRGMLRAKFTDAAPVATFTVTPAVDSEGTYFDCVLSDVVTAAIPLTTSGPDRLKTRFAYDIEAVLASGSVIRVLEGIAEVSPEATK